MASSRIGPLSVHVRGGEDRNGGGDGPAVLLCHGFGAPGDDLVALSRVIDAGSGVRWFFPEALLEAEVGPGMLGRAWWPIDMERLVGHLMRGDIDTALATLDEVPPGLDAAREALVEMLGVLERSYGVKRDRLIVGGFSQGAMLATELAMTLGEPFAGLALLSGTRVGGERWREGAAKLGGRLHAFMTHGRRDPILPFGRAEAVRDMLQEAGAHVTFVPHNGAHEIPQIAVERLGAFARERFGG
jgi:phospholipase/carboxylesterase